MFDRLQLIAFPQTILLLQWLWLYLTPCTAIPCISAVVSNWCCVTATAAQQKQVESMSSIVRVLPGAHCLLVGLLQIKVLDCFTR